MINPREIIESREFRKPLLVCAAAIVVWTVFFAAAAGMKVRSRLVSSDLVSGGGILNYAMRYRALPRTGVTSHSAEEPLGIISQIVDGLDLRDRMQQLQSGQSGTTVQLDKIYGDEMREFLVSAEGRGLRVRTAEIRALPSEGIRLLNAAFTMERQR